MHTSFYDPNAIHRKNLVNGFKNENSYQVCSRCVSDTTVPGIIFDAEGVCNFCHLHEKMESQFPNDEHGGQILQDYFQKVKKLNSQSKYDCVLGFSGGRDSAYLLHCAVEKWNLNPLLVHFNDGFDNPVAGENIAKAVAHYKVDLRTITSDWRMARELKLCELKASTPLLNSGTDVGIGGSLYAVAAKENIKTILFGQSFRTEGIKPLSWAYIDGNYLKDIYYRHCQDPVSKWGKEHEHYNLTHKKLAYYVFWKQIRVFAPLYYTDYVRSDAETILKSAYGWVYPGAHYFDDLYWALIVYIHRTKFNVDLRINSYSALVRCGQMKREQALVDIQKKYIIEDADILRLCVKRLGISWEDFENFMALPPARFSEISNSYKKLKKFRLPIKLFTKMGFFPSTVYDKYFNCGA